MLKTSVSLVQSLKTPYGNAPLVVWVRKIINPFIIHNFQSASPHMVIVVKANTAIVDSYGSTVHFLKC